MLFNEKRRCISSIVQYQESLKSGEMLCLKAEALDDDHSQPSPTTTSNHSINDHHSNGNSNGGFVLPINWGNSIHRYLRKTGKASNRSLSCGDGSLSCSDFEETKPHDKRNGREEVERKCQYKSQLEQDVKKLQQQLQKEIDLRLALSSAVEHSDSPQLDSPYQLPYNAQELLDNIAVLEITVSKLEQESVALQYQLSQERNERRLAQYHLTHLPSPAASMFDCAPACLTEQIMKPCSGEEEAKTGDLPPWQDVIEKPNKDYFVEKLWHHPNQLSEEMVRGMRDIFLFLADSSKISSSEHMASPCSPQGHLSYSSLTSFLDSPIPTSLGRSPSVDIDHGTEVSTTDSLFDPYKVLGKLDWTRSVGAYSAAVEVARVSVGKKELEYAANALKRFRMLVEQLARVNPSCMSCNEKLAFWINLYNALIMHAYLAYGVPRSDMKLFSLMQKAAYTVGGQSLSAADIEYIILKMKPPAHRPQIALVIALQKFKISEEQKQYSIGHPEPLVSFALSCGMHSSPAVRIFRPENVNDLLKTSLKDYVRASIGISDKGKLLVPKLLHCYAKGIVEDSQLPAWICQFLSPEQAAIVRHCSTAHKWRVLGARSYSVLPFDSRFRILFLLEDKDPSSPACKA